MYLCYDMLTVITDVFICWSSPLIWSRFCSWNILAVFWLAGRHTAWPTDAPCPPCPSREAWAGPKQLDGLSWVHHSFFRDEASTQKSEALRNEDNICQRKIAVHAGRPRHPTVPRRNLLKLLRTGGRCFSRSPLKRVRLFGWLFRSSNTSVRFLASDVGCM